MKAEQGTRMKVDADQLGGEPEIVIENLEQVNLPTRSNKKAVAPVPKRSGRGTQA